MPISQPESQVPEALPIFMTASAVARRMNCCGATVRRKLASGQLKPDGILRAGSVGEQVVFSMSRLPEIRQALRDNPIIA